MVWITIIIIIVVIIIINSKNSLIFESILNGGAKTWSAFL